MKFSNVHLKQDMRQSRGAVLGFAREMIALMQLTRLMMNLDPLVRHCRPPDTKDCFMSSQLHLSRKQKDGKAW